MKNKLSLLVCLLALLALYGLNPVFLSNAEYRWVDMLYRFRGNVDADDRIVIVGIDLKTHKWANRPMFAWGPIYAELVQALTEAGAKAVLFDMIFPPTSESLLREHMREVAQAIDFEIPSNFLRAIGFDRQFRSSLIQMVRNNTALILGFASERDSPVYFDQTIMHIAGSENVGYFNVGTASDGKVRYIELFSPDEKKRAYAVSAVAARVLDAHLPSDAYQQINYRGNRNTFTTTSIKAIVESWRDNEDISSIVNDKIVCIGFTSIADFKSTPFGFMPGVEIHANIIDNIINC